MNGLSKLGMNFRSNQLAGNRCVVNLLPHNLVTETAVHTCDNKREHSRSTIPTRQGGRVLIAIR